MDRPDPGARDRQFLSRLKIGFVALVGISAGLIASYAEGSLTEILIAVGAGTLVGVLLVWLAFPSSSEDSGSGYSRRS